MLFLMLYGLLTTAVTYMALLLIKLYAVARPMDARGGVRLRTCVLIVVASWSILLLGIIIAEVVLSTDSSTHFYSTVMKYANALESAIPFLLVGSYLTVLFIYAFTGEFYFCFFCCRTPKFSLLRVALEACRHGARCRAETRHRFRVPLLRLSANIANFALLEFPIAAYYLLEALYGDNRRTKWLLCTGMRASRVIWLLHTAIWPALMARIIVDVVIGFVTDPKIRICKRAPKANSSDQIPASPQILRKRSRLLENSYSPYSRFPVGAALLTEDGTVFRGANVENVTYGATICAERSAIVSAVSAGHRKFKAISIVSELDEPCTPCGICRQFIVEFGDIRVIMYSPNTGKRLDMTAYELLPKAYHVDPPGK
ncbi:cytidine and deoxycytidylate deaminase zinc-binding region domain-containing protein [Ditylenchus destructor]|nr:cytidine and deoxycytidylate deaminase zinc-binding region domain-containing protein [Ditylenchus destructor]